MRLLDAAQRYLDTFDEWPADILDILFIQYPPPRMLRKLLAFLFGNGAPCSLASQLYYVCNTYSSADDTETIFKTYEEWDNNPLGRHISRYYNIRLRKYVYLNGRQRNQNELVADMTDPVPLGIFNTEFPFLIAARIQRIRDTNVFYY
jgi:hypothetical protein